MSGSFPSLLARVGCRKMEGVYVIQDMGNSGEIYVEGWHLKQARNREFPEHIATIHVVVRIY